MSGFYLLVEMIYETAYSNIVASKYDTNWESNEDDISSDKIYLSISLIL